MIPVVRLFSKTARSLVATDLTLSNRNVFRFCSTFVSSHYAMDENTITNYLDRKRFKFKTVTGEIILESCPFCKDNKGQLENMWKLYIGRKTGAYFCHRCQAKGSWFDFMSELGDIKGKISTTQKKTENNTEIEEATEANYPIPDQEKATQYHIDLFEKYPKVVKYLTGNEENERNLDLELLKKYKVGVGTYKFQTAQNGRWEDMLCVTFPCIEKNSNGEEIVKRVKVRALKSKAFQRIDPSGGELLFFGMHTLSPEDDTVILTEGEFDAIAANELTSLPTISLPNGATSLPVELLPKLEKFKKIYLWLDDDTPGHKGAKKFASKLGTYRCHIIYTKNGATEGPKDANDLLMKNKDRKKAKEIAKNLLKSANLIPHDQILTFDDLKDEIFREFVHKEEVRGIQSKLFPKFTSILKGLRNGELTIITGPTGSGKTTFLSQLSLDFCQQGVRTLWGSFELNNVRLAKKMISQFSGINIEENSNAETVQKLFGQISNRFSQLPLYFLKFYGSTSVDSVIDAMAYAHYVHDVEHIILDNLQFMTSAYSTGQTTGYAKFDIQDAAIEKLRKFASNNNVHISLVIHPKKQLDDNALLTNNSIFGTAKATQEADNVVILQQIGAVDTSSNKEPKKFLEVKKNRFSGDLGKVKIQFDPKSSRFIETK